MLNFPPAVRIWLATTPTDLRKSFDTLAELVRQHLHDDPFSGHIFVFRNRRSDRVKLLYWDDDGFVIVYKRLEEGCFRFPAASDGQAGVTLRAAELAMLLDGVDWSKVQRSKRYQRPQPIPAPAAGDLSEK
jgi:transposase